jgi:hypothetical protein
VSRFTRLTNAFSKKFENHAQMVAIYAVWYNWVRIHKTLRTTPAMAAGLSQTVMDWSDVLAVMDAESPKPGRRGPYKKIQTEALPEIEIGLGDPRLPKSAFTADQMRQAEAASRMRLGATRQSRPARIR